MELGFFREHQADLASFSPNLSLASPVKIWLLWDSGKFTRVLWPILGSWGCWLCFNSPRHCQIFLGDSRPGHLRQKESSAEVTWKVTPDWGPAPHCLCQLAFVPVLFPRSLSCCPGLYYHRSHCGPQTQEYYAANKQNLFASTDSGKALKMEHPRDTVP